MQGNAATVTRLFFALLLIFIAIAQSTVLSPASVLGIAPNLVLVLVLLLSSRYGMREGIIWAFSAGILLDLLALDLLGSNAIAMIVVAIIGSLAKRPMLQSGLLLVMLMVLGGTVAHFLIASIIDSMAGTGYSFVVSLRLGLVTAFLNTLTVPILYGVVVLLDRLGVQRVAPA